MLLFDERLSIESGTQSVEAVMGLAVGHSLQSVFAKATNTKQRKKNPIRSELSDLKHEEDKSKYLSCDSSWLLPSTTALIGKYLQCTPN